MKIKFKSFSRRALGKYRPGSIVELSEAEAMDFLNRGYAEPVRADAVCENTALPTKEISETAAVLIAKTEIKIPAIYSSKKKKKKRK